MRPPNKYLLIPNPNHTLLIRTQIYPDQTLSQLSSNGVRSNGEDVPLDSGRYGCRLGKREFIRVHKTCI